MDRLQIPVEPLQYLLSACDCLGRRERPRPGLVRWRPSVGRASPWPLSRSPSRCCSPPCRGSSASRSCAVALAGVRSCPPVALAVLPCRQSISGDVLFRFATNIARLAIASAPSPFSISRTTASAGLSPSCVAAFIASTCSCRRLDVERLPSGITTSMYAAVFCSPYSSVVSSFMVFSFLVSQNVTPSPWPRASQASPPVPRQTRPASASARQVSAPCRALSCRARRVRGA